ncbi:hypothetical protein GC722_08045 [Auraticoccus sp. F435]|uniref:Uncharacterized protein n=1 Tax=Auraticoccus cholistanensis TaxID=2656650 RepID=A0A6A9UT33_9ACTN|nr:hypothetical protein [Auraticoccus cholistanensis]MVA75973.1 hypothetical protein [Auraticoccus cholistanensis]
MIPSSWLPSYRADDLELIGYLAPAEPGADGEQVVPMTLLGTPLGAPMSVPAAEQVLEEVGLSYLAERWLLRHDDGPLAGQEQQVVVVEVTPESAVLSTADFALVVGSSRLGEPLRVELPTDRLRPLPR